MDSLNVLQRGKEVLDTEIEALVALRDTLDETFSNIVREILACQGKLVITGMGKPGHVGRKLAATFSSLGIPSFFLHPAEAMHGDLGMLDEKDLVLAMSYSGESDEIIGILPNIKLLGPKIVAVTGNADSTLAKAADMLYVLPPFREACQLGLAPTSSTTVTMALGDALAVASSESIRFTDCDFGKRHPAGSLGKKLILKVGDLMADGDDNPKLQASSLLVDAIEEISNKRLGAVSVVDGNGRLVGIITDGDLRRLVGERTDIYGVRVEDVMTRTPSHTRADVLAVDALGKIRELDVNCLPVVDDDGILVGLITWQSIVSAGIVL